MDKNTENISHPLKVTIPENATSLITCDINDFNSRTNYDLSGGTASYIDNKYQYQFIDAYYDVFSSHDCSDEWNTNSIYYPEPWDMYKYKFEYVWDDYEYTNVACMNLYSYDSYCDVDMEVQNTPNINAIQSELRFDYRLPYNTKIEVYQNDEFISETDMEDEYSYNTAFITLYNGVNYGDKFTFRFITRDGSYIDAKAYIKNISFESYIPDTMQMNFRYKPNKDTGLIPTKDIKEGRFVLDINGYNLNNNSYTSTYIELCPDTLFYPYNTIKIDEIREYPEITLDNMYIRVCAKRENTLYKSAVSDFTLYTYEEKSQENTHVSINLGTKRKISNTIFVSCDTNRYIVPNYSFKLDYDYLVANPNAFNMSRALVNHADKTFSFDDYNVEQVASHTMTKASEPNNIEYNFVFPYNDDNEEQDISAFTFSSEYDAWSGKHINYGAISLPELHRVYGMIIVKGLDKSKSHTMKFKIKVATVGDLENGEADFVFVGTDSTMRDPQLITCTNEYKDVSVTLSNDDIWDDGTCRVYLNYNNFHFGNFVDVEIRIGDIEVESTVGHGLDMIFQSAYPVDTKAIKKYGANLNWISTQTDKVTKTVGFSTTKASNVYKSNIVMFGDIDGINGKNRSLSVPGEIDYILEDTFALDSNCPDKAYLTIKISRPADLSQEVNFKSLEILGTDTHISRVNMSLDTTRNISSFIDIPVKNSSILYDTVKANEKEKYIENTVQVAPINDNCLNKLEFKVFRRDNYSWQTGNTDKVWVKYSCYDKDNKALTGELEVPSGDKLVSSAVTVKVSVPRDTKYVKFRGYMATPTNKENRIRIDITGASVLSSEYQIFMVASNEPTLDSINNRYKYTHLIPSSITTGEFKVETKCYLAYENTQIFGDTIAIYNETGSSAVVEVSSDTKDSTPSFAWIVKSKYIPNTIRCNLERRIVSNANIDTDTKKLVIVNHDTQIDLSRRVIFVLAITLMANTLRTIHLTKVSFIDTKRKVLSSVFNLKHCDTLRIIHSVFDRVIDTLKVTSRSVATPFDTKKLLVKNLDIKTDTLKQVYKTSNKAFDTNRFTVLNSNVSNDTLRATTTSRDLVVDTKRLVLGAGDYMSWFNTKRCVIKDTNTLSDTKKWVIVNHDTKIDSLRTVIFKTGPIVKKLDTKRLIILNTDTYSDLFRFLVYDTHKIYDTCREVYFKVNVINGYDTLRVLIKEDNIVTDSKRFLVEKATNISDTSRDIFLSVDNNIDTFRALVANYNIKIDTDRLPFIFINNLYDAKREQVYLKPVYKYDTLREVYIVNMTYLYTDTLRAITKDIDKEPITFNISITDTLFFDIIVK